jgi:hypothetical protein
MFGRKRLKIPKRVIKNHNWKDRQHNGQKKKNKKTNIGRENTTQKRKD